MNAVLIDGKALSARKREEIKKKCEIFEQEYGRKICLAVVLVGNDPASEVYVRNKIRGCEATDIRSLSFTLPQTASQNDVEQLICALSADESVDGILVQLPLPKGLDEDRILNLIPPGKDVDGFHPVNVGKLLLGKETIGACTPMGVMTMLHDNDISVAGKNAVAEILSVTENWGGHDYELEMAVCPTKNADRYEWFAEKACETGIDSIVPVCGEHSERRIIKPQRLDKILLSATKQSLKARIPAVREMVTVKEYADSLKQENGRLKLIAYCFEDESHPRISIKEALDMMPENCRDISVLIGPEGDFSAEEASLALECGFIPVHLGPSRLRTETAAFAAVCAVYPHFLL